MTLQEFSIDYLNRFLTERVTNYKKIPKKKSKKELCKS